MCGPSLHEASPAELRARIEAERAGKCPWIVRDPVGGQRILALEPARAPLSIGRDSFATFAWPGTARSRACTPSCTGRAATGPCGTTASRATGTFGNGDPDHGHLPPAGRRSSAVRHDPADLPHSRRGRGDAATQTSVPASGAAPPVSGAQRRVAVALCRPFGQGGAFASPATNQEIADDLVLSVPAVKTHLRARSPLRARRDAAPREAAAARRAAAADGRRRASTS